MNVQYIYVTSGGHLGLPEVEVGGRLPSQSTLAPPIDSNKSFYFLYFPVFVNFDFRSLVFSFFFSRHLHLLLRATKVFIFRIFLFFLFVKLDFCSPVFYQSTLAATIASNRNFAFALSPFLLQN